MKIFGILFFVLLASITCAQSVKLKGDKVLIDNVEGFGFKKDFSGNEITLLDKNTSQELIFIMFDNNGTTGYQSDDFLKLMFLTLDETILIRNSGTWKTEIKNLLVNGVFDIEGNLNQEKVDLFRKKYEIEKKTNTTTIILAPKPE